MRGACVALLSVLTLTSAACDAGSQRPSPTTKAGDIEKASPPITEPAVLSYCDGGSGDLVWVHDTEPPDMHLDSPDNGFIETAWIREALLEGLHGVTAEAAFVPELLEEVAVLGANGDGTFTAEYHLRGGLKWSDGTALTSADVEFTFEIIMATAAKVAGTEPPNDGSIDQSQPNFVYNTRDRTGYDTIAEFDVVSPTEFLVTWDHYYGGWKALFNQVYPRHVFSADPSLAAEELNVALGDWSLASGEPIPTSGPMIWGGWQRTETLELVRNENYHGSNRLNPDTENKGLACIARLIIEFVEGPDEMVEALKAGRANVAFSNPRREFVALLDDQRFMVNSSAGLTFEHWGLNLRNSHLSKPEVREAIALAMDKAGVVAEVYEPLFGGLLPTSGLGNAYWMPDLGPYEDHQGDVGYGRGSWELAKQRLEDAGYTLGDDGIYQHPSLGRLSLRVGTTGGDLMRELQQLVIQGQLSKAGIEIVVDNLPGYLVFGVWFGGDTGGWDIAQFAWINDPWPGILSASFVSNSANNIYGFANEEFDRLAVECNDEMNELAQGDCFNELDVYVTTLGPDGDGLFVIPITQRPSLFLLDSSVVTQGPVASAGNRAGPLANIADYKVNPVG